MAATIAQIVDRVFYRIAAAQSEPAAELYRHQIESYIPVGCNTIAVSALGDRPEWRPYVSKTYTITLSGSTYPLTGAAFADLYIESLPKATLVHASNDYPLIHVKHAELYWPHPDQFIYYAIAGETLRTRNIDGTLDTLTGDITAHDAVFVPVVGASAGSTTLAEQLEDDLVEILVAMAGVKSQSTGAKQ
jgi:hypothetical protein